MAIDATKKIEEAKKDGGGAEKCCVTLIGLERHL